MSRISRRMDDYKWFPFEPGLWFGDNGVQMSSWAARGLWFEMLCRMWFSNTRGVLPGDLDSLATLFRAEKAVLAGLIKELEDRTVFSRGGAIGDGLPVDCIVNRRMYREWIVKKKRAEAGRKGGLAKAKQNQKNVEQNPSKIATAKYSNGNGIRNIESSKVEASGKQRSLEILRLNSIGSNNKSGINQQHKSTPQRVGELLPCTFAPPVKKGDAVSMYREMISVAAPGFEWRDGHVKRLERILGHPAGAQRLDDLVNRVERGACAAQGRDVIGNPAAFVNHEMAGIARELGVV